MLRLTDYETPLGWPTKENFTTRFYYRHGELIATVRPGEDTPAIAPGAVKETSVNEEAFKIARAEYGRHEAALRERFVVDLLKDNGVADNEFTRALYGIAWDQSHSSGLHEVESTFGDLCHLDELAKKVYG